MLVYLGQKGPRWSVFYYAYEGFAAAGRDWPWQNWRVWE
jgi:hypothetical protein